MRTEPELTKAIALWSWARLEEKKPKQLSCEPSLCREASRPLIHSEDKSLEGTYKQVCPTSLIRSKLPVFVSILSRQSYQHITTRHDIFISEVLTVKSERITGQSRHVNQTLSLLERHSYYLKHQHLVYHDGLASHHGGFQCSSGHIANSYAKKYNLLCKLYKDKPEYNMIYLVE